MTKDDFNDTSKGKRADLVNVPFPTKEKLLHLINEQNRVLSKMQPEYKPDWALDNRDERRNEYRLVSRARGRTETRLDKAVQGFRHDFDWNS